MDGSVQKQVEDHILNASGLGVKSRGYRVIQNLFSKGELDVRFNYELILDVRRGCILLGLDVQLRNNLISIDEDSVKKYYEEIMGLKYPEQKHQLTHYEKVKMGRKK